MLVDDVSNKETADFDFNITYMTDAETQDLWTAIRPLKRGLSDVGISFKVQL